MPVKVGDGTYRIRRRTPGYRSGVLVLRLGVRDRKIAQRWEQLALDAYHDAQYEVLDALVSRQISFPEALKLRDQGGWNAVKEVLEQKRAARESAEYDAESLLRQFVETNPKGVRDKTLRTIASHAREFISWLKDRHGVNSVDVRRLFTSDNLRSFRDSLIATRHAAAATQLEARWLLMGDSAPPPVERERILESDRGAKAATANRYVNSVGSFSSWLVSQGILQKNPAAGVRKTTHAENPHRERVFRYLTPRRLRTFLEFSRLYDQLNPAAPGTIRPDTLFWRFLVATGATTFNEGTRFRIRHLDVDREADGMIPCYLHGTKTPHRPREVPIPADLARELVARAKELGIGEDALLFPFSHDAYLSVWKGIMGLIKRAKPDGWERLVKHSPYDLRHTFAVNALRNGVDLLQLQRLLGHSSIETTRMYARHLKPPRRALKRMAYRLGI